MVAFEHLLTRRRYLVAPVVAVAVAITLLALVALDRTSFRPPPAIVLLLPVLLAAYIGRLSAGLAALGLVTLGACVLLVEFPLTAHDGLRLVALAIVGGLMCGVIEALHRARVRVRRGEVREVLFERAFHDNLLPMSLSRLDDRIVVDVNTAYLRTFELSRDRVVGAIPTDAGLVIDRAETDAAISGLRRTGSVDRCESLVITPSGRRKIVRLSANVIELDGVLHVLTSFVDETERRRAETDALDTAAQFRELAEAIQGVFWLTDPANHAMLYVSPGYDAIFGRSRAPLYAHAAAWLDAVHPDDRGRLTAFHHEPVTAASSERGRIVRPDGSLRTLQITLFPVRDASGKPIRVAGMAEDITERLELEEQVRQTQKLESLGLLAGGVAHDFNNLLAVIGASAGMLGESVPRCSPGHELVEEIDAAVVRATALTRQLLAFSRKEIAEPVVLDLNAAVRDTRKMLRRMMSEDIKIDTSFELELGHVRIDPGHFVQVLMNLAVNARDAMPRGGALTIATRNETTRAGRFAVLTISDTGCGMSAEVKAHAFEPFFTTKGVGKGTGLGLSVVHGIVDQAGGTIEVHSEVDRGTTFEIRFPSVDAPAEKIRDLAIAGSHGTERLLVVDDDPYVRASTARALRSRGYRVLEASDAISALRVLREDGDHVDLLVTDVVMPGRDGGELAAEARRELPNLKVLFTSGYNDDAIANHGVDPRAAFLEKPFRIHELAGKVRQVLDAA